MIINFIFIFNLDNYDYYVIIYLIMLLKNFIAFF